MERGEECEYKKELEMVVVGKRARLMIWPRDLWREMGRRRKRKRYEKRGMR